MITDTLGRQFKKLRVSLTSECNFACNYCVGNDHAAPARPNLMIGDTLPSMAKPLSAEKLVAVVGALHQQLQLHSIRLTGGEPLLAEGVDRFIRSVVDLGITDIRLTTNGYMLAAMAEKLKNAGLTSVNISLDALDPEIFFTMSRKKGLYRVLEGVEASLAVGLHTRINTVVMRNRNESQILPLLDYAMERGIEIRYLELMGMGSFHKQLDHWLFSEKDILATIRQKYPCQPLIHESSSTANYWKVEGKGLFGIIANESSPFCADCNRLRLDSFGNIYGCLTTLKGINISREALSKRDLSPKLSEAMSQKQTEKFLGNTVSMQVIGG